ncbi:ribosomal RNA methyltransferase [Hamiltosporidium tvaerminnensis]|uniref:Ribosomal RNA methyltransferase n=1 Tax=Hamiltosporidium tvaerminnensis TaxID=1176355 RepID=A0A4Q9LVH5_9MICR|nr:ribosomal RNA methyltransferase [Hamiltosporidium tvaerminnensis]
MKKKIGKNRKDKYYSMAKEDGYRSRAAYKLIQLNAKYNFLSDANILVDLCAAPGGWLQVASKYMPVTRKIIGIDLDPIKPLNDVETLICDITHDKCKKELKRILDNNKVDVFLHDGAPNMGACWNKDSFVQNVLVLNALKLSASFLKKGGIFISKVFRSKDYSSLLWVFNQFFTNVSATKPLSSRNESAEIFVICKGFIMPDKIDSDFFKPEKVFSDSDNNLKTKDILKNREKGKVGEYNDFKFYKIGLLSNCLVSKNLLLDFLTFSKIVVDFDIKNGKEVFDKIFDKECLFLCEDLKVIIKIKNLIEKKEIEIEIHSSNRKVETEIDNTKECVSDTVSEYSEEFSDEEKYSSEFTNSEDYESCSEEFNENDIVEENDTKIKEIERKIVKKSKETRKMETSRQIRNIKSLKQPLDNFYLDPLFNKRNKTSEIKSLPENEIYNESKSEQINYKQESGFSNIKPEISQTSKLENNIPVSENIKKDLDDEISESYSCSDSLEINEGELRSIINLKENKKDFALSSVNRYVHDDHKNLPSFYKKEMEELNRIRDEEINYEKFNFLERKNIEALDRRKRRALKRSEKVLKNIDFDSDEDREQLIKKIFKSSYKKTKSKPKVIFPRGKNINIPNCKGKVKLLDRRMKKDKRNNLKNLKKSNIGLEINKEKSATNDSCWEDNAILLEYIGEVQTKFKARLDDAMLKNHYTFQVSTSEELYNSINNELVSVNDSFSGLKKGNGRPYDKAMFCYRQDRNLLWGASGMCQHCNQSMKTVKILKKRLLRCIHLLFLNKYKFKSSKLIRSHRVQEILDNKDTEIRVNIWKKTEVKIRNIRPDISILDTKKYGILENVTVERIYFDRRRDLTPKCIISRAEMHKQPTPPLKQVDNEEDGVKKENTKNIFRILDGITTVKELTKYKR